MASLLQSAESEDVNMIEAPNLIGKSYQDYKKSDSSVSSESQDYQVLLSTKQFNDTVPEGCIISQSPTPGTKMAKGSEIVVVVSQGAAVRTLPAIARKSLTDASKAVTDAGFVPVKIEEYSATVPAGMVIDYQTVKAGSQMANGSQVVISVSKGPDPNAASTVSTAQ
jgi:serine/threonine-protein kinase